MELTFKKEDVQDVFPMSDISLGMVYHSMLNSSKAVYHDQMVYQVKVENFDTQRFNKAFSLLVEKHENLRSNFNLHDFDQPLQIVFKNVDCDINHEDISQKSIDEQEKYIKEFLEKDKKNPFRFSVNKPLWRIKTFLLGNDKLCIIWINHHSIVDGWSTSLVMTELLETYTKLEKESGFIPQKLKSNYKDYILKEKAANKDEAAIDFWLKELDNAEGFNFPGILDDKEPLLTYSNKYDKEFLDEIKKTAKQHNITVKSICFAAYLYSLSIISDKQEILAGIINNNRPVLEDADKIVGCFLNTIPVKTTFNKKQTWKDYFVSIDQKLKELKKHESVSFREIVKNYERKNKKELNINTFFNFTDFFLFKSNKNKEEKEEKNENSGNDTLLNINSYERTNTLFDFLVDISTDKLKLEVRYYNSVVPAYIVSRLDGYFKNAILNLIKYPGRVSTKKSCMDDSEREFIQKNSIGKKLQLEKDKTIFDLFRDSVNNYPDRIAVAYKDKQITYKELDIYSDSLALHLLKRGVKEKDVIGISITRSVELIISLFAIIKTGSSYLPVNTDMPIERFEYILQDSSVEYLLTNQHNEKHQNLNCKVIHIKNNSSFFLGAEKNENKLKIKPQNPAYIIYTSGSTGKPKGTIINHISLYNRLVWMQNEYPLTTHSKILQKTSISFDVSVWELFWWSMYGASLYLLEDKAEANPQIIAKNIKKTGITHLHFVPSMLEVFLQYIRVNEKKNDLKNINVLFSSGEALNRETVETFNNLVSSEKTKLINLYGPTEATIDVTYYDCTNLNNDNNVPIGKPIFNTQMHILDKKLENQPVGIKGDLYISGVGLSAGYLNNPELTADRFIQNSNNPGEIIYKTQDIAKWNPDGNIEFIGREDNQVKIRGFRVELGEIESHIRNMKAIEDAVVLVKSENGTSPKIIAFVKTNEHIKEGDIENQLMRKLPQYMIPGQFHFIDDFPHTMNGKINRKALLDLSIDKHDTKNYIQPQTDYEKKIAKIWQDVLGLDKIGLQENFFQVGGDSITILKVYNELCKQFNKQIEIVDLFRYTTIEGQAGFIKNGSEDNNQEAIEDESLDMLMQASDNLFEYE